jgi:hypothetical protein
MAFSAQVLTSAGDVVHNHHHHRPRPVAGRPGNVGWHFARRRADVTSVMALLGSDRAVQNEPADPLSASHSLAGRLAGRGLLAFPRSTTARRPRAVEGKVREDDQGKQEDEDETAWKIELRCHQWTSAVGVELTGFVVSARLTISLGSQPQRGQLQSAPRTTSSGNQLPHSEQCPYSSALTMSVLLRPPARGGRCRSRTRRARAQGPHSLGCRRW